MNYLASDSLVDFVVGSPDLGVVEELEDQVEDGGMKKLKKMSRFRFINRNFNTSGVQIYLFARFWTPVSTVPSAVPSGALDTSTTSILAS